MLESDNEEEIVGSGNEEQIIAGKPFPPHVTAILSSLYKRGVTGWGEKHAPELKIAMSAGLGFSQVQNWICRENTKRRAEADIDPDMQRPLKKARSPWQQYLKNFAKEQAGEHLTATVITQKASATYKDLKASSKEELKQEAKGSTKGERMSRAEVEQCADKIGANIQKSMNELETLGYTGLAVAFARENTIAIGTSKTLKCFSPEFVEYVHAVIMAANPPPVPKPCTDVPSPQSGKGKRRGLSSAPAVKKKPLHSTVSTPKGEKRGKEQDHSLFLSSESKPLSTTHKPSTSRSASTPHSASAPKGEKQGKEQDHPLFLSSESKPLSTTHKPSTSRSASTPHSASAPKGEKQGKEQDHPLSLRTLTSPSTLAAAASTVDLTVMPDPKPTSEWMQKPYLLEEDNKRLLSGSWLNCRLIEAAQLLLKEQYPHIQGLQSPLYGESKRFRVVEGDYIQVLNIRKSHWVCVSNVGHGNDDVSMYDSAFTNLCLDTKRQVCLLLKPTCDRLHFNIMNVQRQTNSSDCGLFAIANATELALGKDPQLSVWDTSQMRSHLFTCFVNGKMVSFPLKRQRRELTCKKEFVVSICRTCQMPNRDAKNDLIIQCDGCDKWFHYVCMGLDSSSDMSEIEWYCYNCHP